MSQLSISIIEDDKNILFYYESEIEEIISRHGLSAKVVCATSKPAEFLEAVKAGRTNVCFIDINLKTNMNGMYLAEHIRNMHIPVEIIFITGHLEYIKNAFQVRAFDYIEKPVTGEVLEKCLLRLFNEMNANTAKKREIVEIKASSQIYYVPVNEITYVEHNNSKTVIHTGTKTVETYDTLESVVKRLPSGKFKQCHRAIFINKDYIDSVSSKEVRLTSGDICILSEKFKKEFTGCVS